MSHLRPLVAAFALTLVAPVLTVSSTSPAAGAVPTVSVVSTALTNAAAPRVRQRAKLLMHPQIADSGRKDRSSRKAKSAMTGQFRPVRKGRPVLLQRRAGGRWDTVQRARQDRKGRVDFVARYKRRGDIQRYRVVAPRFDGLRRKASKRVRTDKWGRHDFRDEFRSFDHSAWSDRLQGYNEDSLRKCSKADPRARKVKRGTLRLKVLNDPDRGKCRTTSHGKHAYRLNGHIGSQNQETFLYGYAAARIKFQPRAGQHASFWMQPQNSSLGNGGAEIDIIEWFGNRRNDDTELTTFVYKDGTKIGGFIKNHHRYGKKWARRYHVFSVEWTPKKYVFRIDGKETFRTRRGVSDIPQYLILSLLSSDYELPLLDGRLPQTMKVDWVKYWGSRV